MLIIPDRYRTGSWYIQFFDRLCKDMDFKLYCTSEVNVLSDVEIIVTFAVPHFTWPNNGLLDKLDNLDSRIPVVCWTGDLHCGDIVKNGSNSQCKRETLRMFDRADLILSNYDNRMKSEYVEYLDKYVYIPLCFAPYEQYVEFEINENPRMQCLQVGASNPKVYPLRNKIRVYAKTHSQIQYVRKIPRESYPDLLHQYFCGIVDVGHNEVVQPKYFEIPAVGSLLLGRRTNLIDDLGFIPYEHYVPFTGDDVFTKAGEILSNPAKYEDMRRVGMKFARDNHTLDIRMKIMYTALEELL